MTEHFKQFYSPTKFIEKISLIPTNSNQSLIQSAVTLFVILSDDTVPLLVKSSVVASLGYLIFPFDAIPDIFMPLGFIDDSAVIATTVIQLQMYNTEEVQNRVEEIMKDPRIIS